MKNKENREQKKQLFKEKLQNVFVGEVKKLKLINPGADIINAINQKYKTKPSSGMVSTYLSGVEFVSEKFFEKFCGAFEINYDKIIEHINKNVDDILGKHAGEAEDADYAEEIPEDEMLSLEIKLSTSKETILIGKQSYSRLSADDRNNAFPGWRGIPMYNNAITASFIETYRDEIAYKPTYYLHDVRFKECNFGARVTGDSMHSEIRHGDHVICQEITDTRFIVYGDIYYIVSTNGLETCKYIHPDPDNKTNLLLVARNESVPSSPMPKDMLLKLYKVKGILREY